MLIRRLRSVPLRSPWTKPNSNLRRDPRKPPDLVYQKHVLLDPALRDSASHQELDVALIDPALRDSASHQELDVALIDTSALDPVLRDSASHQELDVALIDTSALDPVLLDPALRDSASPQGPADVQGFGDTSEPDADELSEGDVSALIAQNPMLSSLEGMLESLGTATLADGLNQLALEIPASALVTHDFENLSRDGFVSLLSTINIRRFAAPSSLIHYQQVDLPLFSRDAATAFEHYCPNRKFDCEFTTLLPTSLAGHLKVCIATGPTALKDH
ncbi:hypothetical protein MN608_11891 [Microdochium nivale]|nr:hypothetical protein MN608_11891 [Microdochium nivale]